MTSIKRRAIYFLGIFSLSLIMQYFQITVHADNSFGAGLTWYYDQNKHSLTVSAVQEQNNMPDFEDPMTEVFSDDHAPWYSLKNKIETVNIEYGVTNIGNNAFLRCPALKKVVLPSTLISIGDNAFSDCGMLDDISFPNALIFIGSGAFKNCVSIKNIELPENVTSIMTLAFSGCSGVEKIKVDDNNPVYSSIGNCLLNKNKKSLVLGCKNSVIPTDGSAVCIDPYAFLNCTDLESINIPKLERELFNIGQGAFSGCDSLRKVRYFGRKSDWDLILKSGTGPDNEPLKKADICCVAFDDIRQNLWYYDAIQYVSTAGIIVGYQNGRFGANDLLKRQDAVVILSRLSKDNIASFSDSPSFIDVPVNAYYSASVLWGKVNHIVNGYTNGRFGVGDRVTREQFLCFLYRYAAYMGIDTETKVDKSYFEEKYIDFKNISPYAVDAVCWALEKGIISGRTANTIAPADNAKRCEISQIFLNIYKNRLFE